MHDRRLYLQTEHPFFERVLPLASENLWARTKWTKCQSKMTSTVTLPLQSLLNLSSLLGALPAPVHGSGAGTTKARAEAAMARSRAGRRFLSSFNTDETKASKEVHSRGVNSLLLVRSLVAASMAACLGSLGAHSNQAVHVGIL